MARVLSVTCSALVPKGFTDDLACRVDMDSLLVSDWLLIRGSATDLFRLAL